MRFKLNALRSVVAGDLSPSDEYAVASGEEVAFFARHFHGALRRHREARAAVTSADGDDDDNEARELVAGAVAAVLPFLFELLHVSQFQHASIAARLGDAALALLEDVSADQAWAPLLAPHVQQSVRGCLDTNCEAARKHLAKSVDPSPTSSLSLACFSSYESE